MPGVIARANRPTEVWPQTLPDRVLALPDPVRQRFIDHDHLALRRDVGPFETAASDDRDAHRLEIIAHDELVVVDDLNGPSIGGGVVLNTCGDRVWRSIRWQTRHDGRPLHAGCGAKPLENALICLRARVGL